VFFRVVFPKKRVTSDEMGWIYYDPTEETWRFSLLAFRYFEPFGVEGSSPKPAAHRLYAGEKDLPRVVPSQVVPFIETKIPWIGPGQPPAPYADRGAMRGLVRLIDKIPEELLVLGGADYAELVMAIGVLDIAWQDEGPGREYAAWERSAIRTLHRIMQLCPDDYPPSATTEPAFITDNELRKELHRDIGEVNRALQNGEWKAATVLAGSVVEAFLLWAVQNRKTPVEVAASAAAQAVSEPIERWGLAELVKIAHHLGLISNGTKVAAEQAREFRNLIHPGRAQRLAARCNRSTALLGAGAIEAVIVDLK
jgi:hypothetical protein